MDSYFFNNFPHQPEGFLVKISMGLNTGNQHAGTVNPFPE
jgi:hypothetical protein